MLKTLTGAVLNRNFVCFVFHEGAQNENNSIYRNENAYAVISCDPKDYAEAEWSEKQWNAQDGNKVNGAGHGYFTYSFALPGNIDPGNIESGILRMELSSKKLMGKDKDEEQLGSSDYMRGGGLHDPSKNPNSYPMTDTYKFPSLVRIFANGINAGEISLPDDPADHQGILSWHNQKKDATLDEAGTYGYLTDVIIPPEALKGIKEGDSVKIRLEVGDSLPGGLAIYGKKSGKYPVNPMLIFKLKN